MGNMERKKQDKASVKKKTLIKVILIGDSGVGKTSLMQRFIHNKFFTQFKTTIGADFSTKDIMMDERPVSVQVWDTAGQERYQSLGVAFYKGAEVCLMVYDITNPKSFETLQNWKSEFLKHAAPKNPDTFPFIIMGNKMDKSQERKVTTMKAKKWCKENGDMPHFEVSAADTTNVEEAFQQAAKLALENQSSSTNPAIHFGRGKKLTREAQKKTGCAC
eukprot:TRINITY_DN13377_c0_g1_i1.p1 TRINITY_DN13377_c0_g1~~TRINITY_DN13377_c0_g1_i1.p1  ORF type:complete len:218 (+),score=32.48 TRINITY_DN13377_c0_g1_i1:171-824(+)